jgi:hypothetical protein
MDDIFYQLQNRRTTPFPASLVQILVSIVTVLSSETGNEHLTSRIYFNSFKCEKMDGGRFLLNRKIDNKSAIKNLKRRINAEISD